jgi:rare lipoprotein A
MLRGNRVVWACVGLITAAGAVVAAEPAVGAPDSGHRGAERPIAHTLDHSGRTVHGKASYYAKKFDGRKMANGRTYDPHSNIAASKTLPLGTTARVVNLDTGKSATVKVEDRGPYARGRVMDVSPQVAAKLEMKHAGVAPVAVKPIAVPQPDGGVKLGTGAAEIPHQQVADAIASAQESAGR